MKQISTVTETTLETSTIKMGDVDNKFHEFSFLNLQDAIRNAITFYELELLKTDYKLKVDQLL